MKKSITFYKRAMENNEILKGVVVLTQKDEELDTEILVLDLDGMRGVIKREDVDYEVNWKSLVNFIGMEIFYTVKDIDFETKTIYCSRKESQERLKDEILERLDNGDTMEATITGMTGYGAHVEMSGIYGFVRNTDFSDSFIKIRDVLRIGDKLNVKLVKISDSGKVSLEPVEKYVPKTVMKFDNFERNQVVLGTVNNVKPWGAYVTIAPGFDALCPIPEAEEIEEGTRVSFRITQVQEDKERVRGKIIRVIA